MSISDATETILSVNHPDAYAELTRLRAQQTVLVEALQLGRRRICDLIDANPGVSPANQAANRAINEMDKALATLDVEEKM